MKKAVMYGAGNIGRGFIGKAFYESGYDVCFVDVADDIVGQLNRDGRYPVKIISGETEKIETVQNVHAVNGRDAGGVAREIAAADIMATAVGVNVLPHIIKPVCAGLKKRFDEGGQPLNIIICENLIDADKYLRRLIEKELGPSYKAMLDRKLGLVVASIGRMAPVMTNEMKEGNNLMVWVEPYDELPVNKDAFIGEPPKIKGIAPFSPFGFYIKRKLFIHNMSHAVCAYLGWRKGYTYIYECIGDKEIRRLAKAAMSQVAKALHSEYGIARQELDVHIGSLLNRFANTALGDTVARVGRDPLRKLAPGDRLIGSALYCMSHGFDPSHIVIGIVAALLYDNAEDEAATRMQRALRRHGAVAFIKSHCGLAEDSPLLKMIREQISKYNTQKERCQ